MATEGFHQRLDIQKDGIVKETNLIINSEFHRYSIYSAAPAKGILYMTYDNNYFISGHIRMRAGTNGKYPFMYEKMIDNLFGPSDRTIEVCSYKIEGNDNLFTVDINPKYRPQLVADGQDLAELQPDQFSRWRCDPPYNAATAKSMWDCKVPNFLTLLKEGARVVKSGSLLFLLLGPTNFQMCPANVKRIGLFLITLVPNNEIRALNIYIKE